MRVAGDAGGSGRVVSTGRGPPLSAAERRNRCLRRRIARETTPQHMPTPPARKVSSSSLASRTHGVRHGEWHVTPTMSEIARSSATVPKKNNISPRCRPIVLTIDSRLYRCTGHTPQLSQRPPPAPACTTCLYVSALASFLRGQSMVPRVGGHVGSEADKQAREGGRGKIER